MSFADGLARHVAIAIAFRRRWICDGLRNDVSHGASGPRTPADEARASEWPHSGARRKRQFHGIYLGPAGLRYSVSGPYKKGHLAKIWVGHFMDPLFEIEVERPIPDRGTPAVFSIVN